MNWDQTYTWRGKTYKTIRGLHNAVLKAYPNKALSFDEKDMWLRDRSGLTLIFARTFDANRNSIIANNPYSIT